MKNLKISVGKALSLLAHSRAPRKGSRLVQKKLGKRVGHDALDSTILGKSDG